MNRLLEVNRISVNFGGVQALKEVSFTVAEGELLGLIGPNGAGKTTAMRVVTGMVSPQEGSVSLEGEDLLGLAINARVWRGLGMSQQIVKPFHSMTVQQNVALAAGAAKTRSPLNSLVNTDRSDEMNRALELLDLLGIGDVAAARPGELPLGYRKRLEMARALALNPKILLLDEPLAGLNHIEAGKLADTIKSLNEDGKTIVLIEHNLAEVMRICSRIMVLSNGMNLKDGDPTEVMADDAVRAAYLGEGAAHAGA